MHPQNAMLETAPDLRSACPRAGEPNAAFGCTEPSTPAGQCFHVHSIHASVGPSPDEATTATWRYQRNQQFSITAVTTSSGSVAERYAYTAYGQPTILDGSGSVLSSSAINNRYTYTGREWDQTLGMYRFRARWMSGVAGRFMRRDPIGYGGFEWNLNCFIRSSSLNLLAPSGLVEFETRYWMERHHWFPISRRNAIESLCTGVGFNIGAFVTPVLAARDEPVLSHWDVGMGVTAVGSINGAFHDHYWLEHARNPRWIDIVDNHVSGGNCCSFLTGMIPFIMGAYNALQNRNQERAFRRSLYPPIFTMIPYIGDFSDSYPIREWLNDEMGAIHDYSGISTLNLLHSAKEAACHQKKKEVDCDRWILDKRNSTPLYGGGLQNDYTIEMLFLPGPKLLPKVPLPVRPKVPSVRAIIPFPVNPNVPIAA